MRKVIQLIGYPRVGKDSFVTILREIYPSKTIDSIAYADKLKAIHMKALNIESLAVYDDHLHSGLPYKNIDLRKALAVLSTKMRNDNPHVFITPVRKFIASSKADIVVCTDLRYPLEYYFAKAGGDTILRINRGDVSKETMAQPWNKHIHTFNHDYVIDNTGTIKDYLLNIDKFVRSTGLLR